MFSNDPWSCNIVSALSFVQKLTSFKTMNHFLLINDSGAKMQMQGIKFLVFFFFFTCTSCLIALPPPMAEGQNLCLLPSQKYFLAHVFGVGAPPKQVQLKHICTSYSKISSHFLTLLVILVLRPNCNISDYLLPIKCCSTMSCPTLAGIEILTSYLM